MCNAAKVKHALRQIRRGRDPATRVPVRYARRRVEQLEAAGMTRTAIAAKAGVAQSTVSRLADRSTKRASRITVAAIMSVSPP
jgi:hypothetical protein